MNKITNVLIYQIGSIGDTIVSIPTIRAVRRHYGFNAKLTLLHDRQSSGLLAPPDVLSDDMGICRFIEYAYSKKSVKQIFNLLKLFLCLKREKYDEVVYLLPSDRTKKQVNRDRLFFKLCGIKKQIGFFPFDQAPLYPIERDGSPGTVKHEALCRLERIKNSGFDISDEKDFSHAFFNVSKHERDKAYQWLLINGRDPEKMLIALCPGSNQPTNLWQEKKFDEIGKRLFERKTHDLLIIGGHAESAIGDRLIESWGKGINAAGKISLKASAALLSYCDFYIGLDTGPTHLAAAIGLPCIALYSGRDNPGRFEPLGGKHIILRKDISCAPCRLIGKKCPLPDHPCMSGITVEMVWEAILKMERSILK